LRSDGARRVPILVTALFPTRSACLWCKDPRSHPDYVSVWCLYRARLPPPRRDASEMLGELPLRLRASAQRCCYETVRETVRAWALDNSLPLWYDAAGAATQDCASTMHAYGTAGLRVRSADRPVILYSQVVHGELCVGLATRRAVAALKP
jgi:hypothetical protein